MVTNAKVTVDDVKKSAATAASTVKTAAANATVATKKAVEEVKKEATVASKKATVAKKTATKKATAAKKTVKKAAAKAKNTVATTAVIQYQGREFSEADCLKKAQAQFKKDYKKEVLEEINIYIKPEENKIYYVANKDRVGSVDL